MTSKRDVPDYLQAGFEVEVGSYTFKADEIIRFGKKFDPQPFHIGAELAKDSLFGGLCASGWHTTAIWMKLYRAFADQRAEKLLAENPELELPEFGPSPGIQNVKWLRPVFAGDTITFTNKIGSIRETKSRPGWWIMLIQTTGINQNGELAVSFENSAFVKP